MNNVNEKSLKATKDWREFYLEQGKEMLALAKKQLGTGDKASLDLGLKIIEEALFEEDLENPDSERSLHALPFEMLVPSLEGLLAKKEWAPRALYGLWVCCQEGARVTVNEKKLEPWLDKANAKIKVHGQNARALAFRVLCHALNQQKKGKELAKYLEGNADLKKVLFDEAGTFPAKQYDFSFLLPAALKNLQAKGEGPAREAITALWNLLTASVDISEAVPILIENQARLGTFTDSNQLLSGYFLKTKKFDQLTAWLSDPNKEFAIRACRGIRMADRNGISADTFLKKPGMKARMEEVETMF